MGEQHYSRLPVLTHPFCEAAMIDPQSDPQVSAPPVRRSKVSIDEALRICRGMTKEESDRLDAETPPFVPETRNGYMTYREDDIGPKLPEPKF